MIAGRARELARIRQVQLDALAARGGSLVVRGSAGIGKSALLRATLQAPRPMTVLMAHGVESESELAFAGLHQILRPALRHLPALPPAQAEELGAALGLSRGRDVDRFLVAAAAALSLLAELAEVAPLLCVIDDAHWLDAASADALLFAAGRTRGDRRTPPRAVRGAAARGATAGPPVDGPYNEHLLRDVAQGNLAFGKALGNGWLVARALALAPVAGADPDPLLPYGPDPQVPTSIGAHVDNHDEVNTTNGHVDLPL